MKRLTAWFKELSIAGRVSVIAAIILGSFITVGAMGGSNQTSQTAKVDSTATPSQPEPKKPVVSIKTETSTEPIAFDKQIKDDPSLPAGQDTITQAGVNGVKTISYDVTYTDGVETNRQQTSETVTIQPVTEITSHGTYVAPKPAPQPASSNCDPNYSGCVPIASDVDCAGGSGNGPAYVSGPIRVIGRDIYGLDRDGNGIACE